MPKIRGAAAESRGEPRAHCSLFLTILPEPARGTHPLPALFVSIVLNYGW
jgi:hypothetical protein